MNLKLRKNWAFWAPLIVGVATMFMGFLNMEPQDFNSWSGLWAAILTFLSNPYFVISVALYILSALIDPTTPGIGDSEVSLAKNSVSDTAQDIVKKMQQQEENEKALYASAKNNGGTK